MSKAVIVIPARYASTRLPGKPLTDLAGCSLLHRVCRIAQSVTWATLEVVVATDDERIVEHAQAGGVRAVMTSVDCASGTDRVFEALQEMGSDAELIVNLQGDAPFTPPDFVEHILHALTGPGVDIATPVHALSWAELDAFRESKTRTPFSGTTAIVDRADFAVWFSKNIIPAIRGEDTLRKTSECSPVLKHVGLYGYRRQALEKIVAAPASVYETLEGLEQLRFLELGLATKVVRLGYPSALGGLGVDSPADLSRAENMLSAHGEPVWMT